VAELFTHATRVDRPVHLAAAYSVTNETIAEIRRVDDSFHGVCVCVCVTP